MMDNRSMVTGPLYGEWDKSRDRGGHGVVPVS